MDCQPIAHNKFLTDGEDMVCENAMLPGLNCHFPNVALTGCFNIEAPPLQDIILVTPNDPFRAI